MVIRLLLILPVLFLISCKDKPAEKTFATVRTHTLAEELRSIYDIRLLPQYRDGSLVAQTSSYDTTGGNDDGFSGRYSFLKRKADSTLVIFQVKGKGVINRIWTPTPNADTLDFYLGQVNVPTFSISFQDLFSGKQFPFVGPLCGNQVGGYFCYLPIPFDDGCTIVSRGKKIQFHQIQYRLYNDPLPVKNFSLVLDDEEKTALEKVATLFNLHGKPLLNTLKDSTTELQEEHVSVKLVPDEVKTIFEKTAGGRIVSIELGPADLFKGLSRDVDIRITWDDENIPAVFCPLADFFGFAFGAPSMQSLLLGTYQNQCYSYFPMPFDRSAKIELINRSTSSEEINNKSLTVSIVYSNQKRNEEQEGKFYAYWNSNRPIKGSPHIFADVSGKGHYVGTLLQAQGLKAGMTYFFEGDDSTAIDGSARMHGTGSEDYFNGGWYALMDRWEGKMSLPLHGALDYSIPFGRTGGYRLFISDKMSFQKSLFHSIEHGPTWNAFPVEYTSLALYYGDKPPTDAPEPNALQSTVYVPDTLYLYPQLMDFNLDGDMAIQTSWKYGTGGLSYRFTVNDNSHIRISLADIPDGTYSLGVDLIEDPSGCDFSIWQRQTRVSDWKSTHHPEEKRTEEVVVKALDVGEFKNTLTFQFKTLKDRNSFLLNRLVLIRK